MGDSGQRTYDMPLGGRWVIGGKFRLSSKESVGIHSF